MSSGDVAQMFAAQNSMFMGQNSYAQSIGVTPPMYGQAGLSGWGSGGSSNLRTPFSYSPAASFGGGFGGGSRFAGGAMSALGGAAAIGAGMAFDPFGSFLGGAVGGLARGGIGAALGGGMMAAAPMIPIAAAAQLSIGSMMRGGQQQGMINTTLGQNFNFTNAASRTGVGFTRDDAKSIGDMVRSISHIPEMMTSVEELTRLMPRLKASGVMQGVKNATEFQYRFKEAISTIRDMSKVMGSTMEEAEQFFAHSRSLGFMGRNAQLKNTMNAQLTSGLTGMSASQVMQLQQGGAGMAQQFGARRSLGVQAVTNIAQRIGLAQREGTLDEGLIENVTGLSGAEGVQAASQKMAGFLMQMSQTAPGRAIMAGAVKFDERGRAVGLDENIIKRLNEGRMSLDELKSRGSNLTGAQKISFMARSSDLGADFAGKVDMGKFMQTLVGNKGGDAANLVLQRLTGGQASAQDIDLMMSIGGASGGAEGELGQMGRLRAREAAFRERTDPSAILRRVKTRLRASTLGAMEQAGAKIYTELGKAYDSFIDDLVGRHAVTLSKEGADAMARAMSGGGREDVKQMLAAAHGLQGQTADTSLLGKAAGAIGDSSIAAFLTRGDTDTGRSLRSRVAFSKEITGGALSDAGQAAFGKLANKGFGAAGSAAGVAAQDPLRRIRAEIENFSSMDDERKLTELRSAVQSRIHKGALMGAGISDPKELLRILSTEGPSAADKYLKDFGIKGGMEEAIRKMEMSDDPAAKDAAKLLRAGQAAQRGGASDFLTGIIGAAQGEFRNEDMQVNISKAITGAGAQDVYEALKIAQKSAESAKSNLGAGTWRGGAGLDDSEVEAITSNPEARKVVSDLLGKDPKKAEAARKALAIKDPEAAAAALGKLGYAVKASDIEAIRGIRNKADAGAGDAIRKSVDSYNKVSGLEQGVALATAAKEKAQELDAVITGTEGLDQASTQAARAVQAAFAKIGEGKGEGVDELEKSIGDLTAKIAKGGPGADKLVAATGSFGAAAQAAVESAQRLKGKRTLSQKEAMETFGLRDDAETRAMLERAGVTAAGSRALGKGGIDVEALTAKVAGFKGAHIDFRKDTKQTGPELTGEQKLMESLTKIDKTLDKNTAVMTLLATGKKAEIDESQVKWAQQTLKENNPPPGVKQ